MHHRFGRVLLVLTAATLAACSGDDDDGDDGAPRDGGVERDGGDATDRDGGFRDSGLPPDAGPPPDSGVRWFESSCADCDTNCPGGLCLTAGGSRERFCADECGGDLDGCIDGYSCVDITGGMGNPQYYCIPPNATCVPDNVNFGTSCYGDTTGCGPGRDWCEADRHALGYCTNTCFRPSDCPAGFECELGDDFVTSVCRATTITGAERCGNGNDRDDLVETSCAIDGDCPPNKLCVRSEPRLSGVCVDPCTDGSTCGTGQTCSPTDRGMVCLSDDCRCHAQATTERDLLGEALANIGLTRCSAIWDVFSFQNLPKDMFLDPYRLSWFDEIHNEPLRGPRFMKGVVADLDSAADSGMPAATRAARMVERLATLVDRPAVTTPPTMPDPVEPLAEAVIDLITASGGAPDRAAIIADAMDVPMNLQLALAEVIDAIRRAELAQKRAVPNPANREALYDFGHAFVARRADGLGLNPATQGSENLFNTGVGYGDLYGAAVDVLDAIGTADLAQFAATPTGTSSAAAVFLFSQDTPIGRIAIGDGEHSIYTDTSTAMPDAWALLVDLGGDDHYFVNAAGNADEDNSVSVLIDLGGSDHYGYVEVPHPLDDFRLPSDVDGRYTPEAGPDEDNGPISLSDTPRQGGGRMGTAVLVDLGTDGDEYRSLRMSQGAGLFGTGVLVDEGGDDVYLAETVAQGAGSFGIGLHFDGGGNDERRSYQFSQGFAYARAAGASYDVDGDDIYFMDPGDPMFGGDPLYISAQRAGRANSTLGQGFAFGRRADFSDRAFMSGGIGILVDADGTDEYTGSIFAQGGGFWFGTGVLADHAGNDTYDALWYAMGTGAHYALGYLFEGGGNDTYGGTLPRVNVTMGGAHDYTASFLIDDAGDDVYWGSRITLGAGNVNGIGFLVDNAGDDQYRPRLDYALGNASLSEPVQPGNARRKVNSIGVFIDAGGNDTYEVADMPPEAPIGNDMAWQQAINEDPEINKNERGSGIDGTGDSTLTAR